MEFSSQFIPIVFLTISILVPIIILYWIYFKINYFLKLKEDHNQLMEELIAELRAKKENN
jgi:hypothetical protein